MMAGKQDGWRELFATVFDRSGTPMSVVDESRAVVRVNQAKATVLGFSIDELLGKRVEELVVESQRGPVADAWDQAIEDGSDFAGEYDMVRSDGSILHVHYAVKPAQVNGRAFFVCIELISHPTDVTSADVSEPRDRTLTPRELEVVRMLALGGTGPEIAEALVVSHETVRTHVRNAMEKTGARTRAQLVAVVMSEAV